MAMKMANVCTISNRKENINFIVQRPVSIHTEGRPTEMQQLQKND